MESVFITSETKVNSIEMPLNSILFKDATREVKAFHNRSWISLSRGRVQKSAKKLICATALMGTALGSSVYGDEISKDPVVVAETIPLVEPFRIPTGAYLEVGSSLGMTTTHLFPYLRAGYVMPLGTQQSWILDMALNGSCIVATENWAVLPFSTSATISPRYVWGSMTLGPEVGLGFNPILSGASGSYWNGLYGLAGVRGTYHFNRHWFLSAGVYAAVSKDIHKQQGVMATPVASVGLGYSF